MVASTGWSLSAPANVKCATRGTRHADGMRLAAAFVRALDMSQAQRLQPERRQTPQQVLEGADQALYQARHQGRDRVVLAIRS